MKVTVSLDDGFGKAAPREIKELLCKADETLQRAEQLFAAPPFTQRPKLRLVVDNEREESERMSFTSSLFRAARLSADLRSLRSPKTAGKRVVRKAIGRTWGRSGIPRWPR